MCGRTVRPVAMAGIADVLDLPPLNGLGELLADRIGGGFAQVLEPLGVAAGLAFSWSFQDPPASGPRSALDARAAIRLCAASTWRSPAARGPLFGIGAPKPHTS